MKTDDQGAIIKDGGPAFPQTLAATPAGDIYEVREKNADAGGMTLRDYFAGQAMAHLAANLQGVHGLSANYLADRSYELAAAMIKRRADA